MAVTPLAISVAGSGSTAIPGPVGSDNRAAERTTLTRSAVGTAIVDLFGGDDESESGTAASQTAPTANAVEEVLADDASWQNPLPAQDEPVVVAAGSGVDDFMSAFDAWDLECFGKKKKTAV